MSHHRTAEFDSDSENDGDYVPPVEKGIVRIFNLVAAPLILTLDQTQALQAKMRNTKT